MLLGYSLIVVMFYFAIGAFVAMEEYKGGYLILWGPLVLRSLFRSALKLWRES